MLLIIVYSQNTNNTALVKGTPLIQVQQGRVQHKQVSCENTILLHFRIVTFLKAESKDCLYVILATKYHQFSNWLLNPHLASRSPDSFN